MANNQKSVEEQREMLALQEIRKALRGLRYGCVTIIVQDGIVIQIEKTSKARIDYSSIERFNGGEGI